MKSKPETKDTAQKQAMSDIADKALKNYEQIVKTGLKLQEEASRCWTSLLNQGASLQDWQKPFTNMTAAANEILPQAQKRVQEVLDLVEKNTRTGTELLHKAADAAQTPVIAESQAKWLDFWTSSLGVARANTEALMQINTQAIDSWIEFVQKNTEVTQVRVPKTA